MFNNCALMTIIQNGNEFFKIWYRYYTQFFPEQNIFVIDFNSNDGSTDNLHCNIQNHNNCNIENLSQGNEIINKLKSKLLKNFKYIMWADYDEILFHHDGLEAVISSKEKYYTTLGYEIVQNRKIEPSIDFTKPIFPQRNYWYRCLESDKPLITSIDFNWSTGNHNALLSIKDGPQNAPLQPNYIKDFYLLHLHKIDYNHCLALNQKNINKGKPVGGGAHNFLLDQDFEFWWKEAEKKLVKIPTPIKNAIINI